MRGVNLVIIVGTLGADPTCNVNQQTGAQVVTVSLATSEDWTDKTNGEKKEKTEWHRIVFFGKLAEVASNYTKKGDKIYVEGKLSTSKYTDKDGVERYKTDIIANKMQLLGSGKKDLNTQPNAVKTQVKADPYPRGLPVEYRQDIPF